MPNDTKKALAYQPCPHALDAIDLKSVNAEC